MESDNRPTEWELEVLAKSIRFMRKLGEQVDLVSMNLGRLGQLEALHSVLITIAREKPRGAVAYTQYADDMPELIAVYNDFVSLYGWMIGWCIAGEVRRSELGALESIRDKLKA